MKHHLAALCLALAAVSPAVASTEPSTFTTTVSGSGRPMVLIPGLACPGAVWESTVARFDDRFACHVVSLAGFGGTPARADGPARLTDVTDELAGYIRSRGLARPVIVGHSLGGFLALDLASRHPDVAGPLVIVDGLPFFFGIMKPDGTAEEAKQAAEATAGGFSRMDPAAYASMIRNGPNGSTMAAASADLDRIIAWGLASDPATVTQAMRDMYSADLRPALARIPSPALVMAAWVGYAPYSSHEFVARTFGGQYATLPDVRIEISDTARHFIMLDEPEWMFARIESFLAAPAAGAARE